jgi:lipopolysaccharide transport system permease protein
LSATVNTQQFHNLRRVWEFRELLIGLIVRNLKVKYQRSALGFVWTLLNPLFTVILLTAVFTRVVRIPMEDYWAFMLTGYFVWNCVLQILNTGTNIMAEHASLARTVAFPSETLILGAAISRLVEFLAELVLILVVISVAHHGRAPASFLLVPLLAVQQFLFSIGLCAIIATISTFYYDARHALPIVLTMLFYISPVFYPASMVPEPIRPLYMVNPMAGLLTLYKNAVYEGQMPSALLLISVTLYSILIAWIGYAIFNRYKATFPEIV